MSHTALLEYIRTAKDRGASDTDVADRLFAAGWYRVDIQDGLELYRKMMPSAVFTPPSAGLASAPAAVVSRPYSSASTSPWPMAIIAGAAFLAGFVGYLLLK